MSVDGADPNSNDFTLGSDNNTLYRVRITSNNAINVDSVSFTIDANSTYQSGDVTAFKVIYSTDTAYDVGDIQLGSSQSGDPGQTLVFGPLAGAISASADNYLLIVADISTNTSAVGRTVQGSILDRDSIRFVQTINPGDYTGTTTTPGNTHDIVSPSVQFSTTSATVTENSGTGTTNAFIAVELFGNIGNGTEVNIQM